jgi:hypothetical protein
MSESWGDRVTVVISYTLEDTGAPGSYEAVTMTGVPHNVIVYGVDEDSAEGALNHLLDGLRAFGFAGRVSVEDFSEDGRGECYEVQTSR